MRLTRSSMLEVLRQDFIRTARSKGASEKSVNYHHALRNAVLPVITVIGIEAAFLIGGLIVTETVFNIPGVARFLVEALRWREGERVQFSEPGEAIVLAGRLFDGSGETLADSLIETWQLSPTGKPPAPASGSARPNGLGRVETAKDGTFRIETLMPGTANGAAPHIEVTVFARGLLRPLRTRVYLADEARVRAEALLEPLGGSDRVKTLIARRDQGAAGSVPVYHWDIRLQGAGETVFFAF